MTSARSLNKSRGLNLYLHTLKSNIGLMASFFLLLIISGPMPFIINSLSVLAQKRAGGFLEANSSSIYASRYPTESLVMYLLVTLLGALVIGLITTSFMHNKRAVDVYGALPVKRETLLLSKSLGGITIILIPYLLSMGVLFAAQGILQAYESAYLVWLIDFASFAVYAVGIYAITVFCATNTGAVFDTAIFSLTMCGAPTIILLLNRMFLGITLVGYSATTNFDKLILGISPIASPFARLFEGLRLNNTGYTVRSLIIWPIAAALILWCAALLFKRRRNEIAGTSKPNGVLQLAMKLMAAYITGVLISTLFIESLENNWSNALLGFVIGAFVAYFITEAILARGFKTVKKMFKQFAVVTAAILICTVIIYTGGFGYSKQVPKSDEVESVQISYNGSTNYSYKYLPYYTANNNTYTEPEIIKQVLLAHQEITKSKSFSHINQNRNNNGNNETYGLVNTGTMITYKLKSGKTISRNFSSTPVEARDYIYGLEGLEAFKIKNDISAYLRPADITSITRTDITLPQEQLPTALTLEQSKLLCEAMKADVIAQTYEQIMTPTERELFTLAINLSYMYEQSDEYSTGGQMQETVNVPVQPWSKNTIAVLRSFGWDVNETPDYSGIGGAYLLGNNKYAWVYQNEYASENLGGLIKAQDYLMGTYDIYMQSQASDEKQAYLKESIASEGYDYNSAALDYLKANRITDKAQIAQLAQACSKQYNIKQGDKYYTVALETVTNNQQNTNEGISEFSTIYLIPESKAPDFLKAMQSTAAK